MSRSWVLALAMAGCSFQANGVDTSGDDPLDASGNPTDAPNSPTDAPSGPSDAFVPDGECSDPSLRLCLRFGDDLVGNTANDGSSYGNHAAVVGLETTSRDGEGDAVKVDGDTIYIAEDPDFNLPSPMTYGAWAKLTAPFNIDEDRWRILDNNDQYSMGFYGDAEGFDARKAYCSIDGDALALGNLPLSDGWHHVACVVAGTKVSLFVDGLEQFDTGTFDVLNQTGQGGTCIGCNCIPGGPALPGAENFDRLIGAVDEVKIWAKALTPLEICTETGLVGCD